MQEKQDSSKNSVPNHVESSVYSAHLAKVNETRQVTASEDILNDRGVLLIKSGNVITPTASRAIAQFKLTKPLHDSITIENEITAKDLQQNFLHFLAKDPILKSIHDRHQLQPILEAQCAHFETIPMLKQKITVMYERMTETLDRTISCTWLALLIANEMHLPPDDIKDIFLAALAHDIGMLHISPETLEKKGQLSAEEWRQIQAHAIISQTILTSMPNISTAVGLAVREHHERCDGTGYPSGKVESELSLGGQILAFSDSVIAVFYNRFKPQGRGWRDVIPFIQMNNNAFLYRNYEILVTVLRHSNLPTTGVIKHHEMINFIQKIIAKDTHIKHWYNDIKDCIKKIGYTHGDRKLHALQNIILHVATAINASGIFQEGLVEWLEQIQDEKITDAYRQVEDIYIMQEEVIFHLQRFSRMTSIYLSKENKNLSNVKENIKEALADCLKKSDTFQKSIQ